MSKNKKNNNDILNSQKISFIGNLKKYFPHILLNIYILEFLYFSINPFDRLVWFLENSLVMIVVILLIVTYKKFRFSNFSYFLFGIILIMHTYGGHYSFSHTPFEFFNNLLDKLDWNVFPEGRNNFDRIGHFAIGILAYPISEVVYRKKIIKNLFISILFGLFALTFWGALYEVLEMYVAINLGDGSGMLYVGSQGDIWDSQNDLMLDILGAMAISILFWWNYRKK